MRRDKVRATQAGGSAADDPRQALETSSWTRLNICIPHSSAIEDVEWLSLPGDQAPAEGLTEAAAGPGRLPGHGQRRAGGHPAAWAALRASPLRPVTTRIAIEPSMRCMPGPTWWTTIAWTPLSRRNRATRA